MNCASCNNPLGDHYRLSRVDRTGGVGGTVEVCSLLCLVKWAYRHGTRRATMGVMMAKFAIGQAIDTVKGTKR